MKQQWILEQKLAAAIWARRMLNSGFVVLDTETTGLDDDDELVQVSVIDHTGEILLDQRLRPQKAIHPQATAVHGLRVADLRAAPPFVEVYPALETTIKDRIVIAYNAKFDRRMLGQTITRYQRRGIRVLRWECAMQQYAKFLGRWDRRRRGFQWIKLTMACGIERIPVTAAHTATGDCLMTLKLIEKMAAAAPDTNPGEDSF